MTNFMDLVVKGKPYFFDVFFLFDKSTRTTYNTTTITNTKTLLANTTLQYHYITNNTKGNFNKYSNTPQDFPFTALPTTLLLIICPLLLSLDSDLARKCNNR